MLAVYVFSMIAMSQASAASAGYSKLAGVALTYVFLAEFLFTRTKSICLPREFASLTLFLLWCLASLFWTLDASWTLSTVQTLAQLLIFWVISVNVMVLYGSILPSAVGMLVGLLWAVFKAVQANGLSLVKGPDDRVGSVLSNANAYAVALTLGILTCLYLSYRSPRLARWLLAGFIVIAVQQIFFFSGSRKGMIGVMLAFALYFSILLILNGRNRPGQIVLFLVGVVVSYFVVQWLVSVSPHGGRLFSYQEEPSFVARENLTGFAISQWKLAPIWGHGANQFRVLYQAHTGIITYSHNNYTELLVNNGVVGLLIFYSFYLLVAGRYLHALFTRQAAAHELAWAFTLIVLCVVWDVAMVSFDDKLTWTVFAQLTALSQLLQRRARSLPVVP